MFVASTAGRELTCHRCSRRHREHRSRSLTCIMRTEGRKKLLLCRMMTPAERKPQPLSSLHPTNLIALKKCSTYAQQRPQVSSRQAVRAKYKRAKPIVTHSTQPATTIPRRIKSGSVFSRERRATTFNPDESCACETYEPTVSVAPLPTIELIKAAELNMDGE